MAYEGIEAPIPLGQHGLLTDLPPSQIPPGGLILANNITLENGYIEKAPGSLKYNDSALSAGVVALAEYWPDSVKQRLFAVTADGKIYRDFGDSLFSLGNAIATGLGSLTPNCHFVIGGGETGGAAKKLFLFTEGKNQLQVLSGDATTFADISTPATDWATQPFPSFGLIHRNRLWVFRNQQSYASNTGDHENFTSGFLTQTVYPGEGGDLIGGFVFRGRLHVFKDGGFSYYLDESSTDSSQWYWKRLGSAFQLNSHNSITEGISDIIAGNNTGSFTSYRATETLGSLEGGDILSNAEMESYVRKYLNREGLSEQHLIYHDEKKTAYATYRTFARTENDALLILDFNKQMPRVYVWPKGTPQCLAFRKDVYGIPKPIYGDSAGFVQWMDYADRLEGGSAYLGEFQTAFTDFGYMDNALGQRNKNFDWLQVEYIPVGNWNLSCDYYIDGKFMAATTAIPMQQQDKYLGQHTLGTDKLPAIHPKTFQVPLYGNGRSISFHFKQSGSNETFKITGLKVGFKPGGQEHNNF